MKYTRIRYEVWGRGSFDDYLCWVPAVCKWVPRSVAMDRQHGTPWRHVHLCAEAKTFARAKWIARRYPGEKVQIERVINERTVRSWTMTRRKA